STKKPYHGIRGIPQQGQNLKTIVGYSHSELYITTFLTVSLEKLSMKKNILLGSSFHESK
ncbi:hypothetical protein, partial [Ornithobacterium rhinotracheale]